MDNYNPDYQYMPPQQPKNENSMKIIAIVVSATIVIVAAFVSFLLIFMSTNKGAGENGNRETTSASTEPATTEKEELKMPGVTGLAKEKAIDKLATYGLTAEISEIESDKEKEGYVFSQVPSEGKAVNEGDKVTLYVAKNKPTEKPTQKVEKKESEVKTNSSVTYLYCIAADFVSLRSGPNSSYTELVKVPSGDAMIYQNSKSGKWYYVKYGNYTGYVFGDYVSFDKNAAINYTPDGISSSKASSRLSPKTYSGTNLYCTASDFVALRSGPNVSYKELARIPHGYSMLYLNSKTGHWYYVQYGNLTGYVYDKYVTFDPDAV